MHRVHLVIRGRVQGVGFRYFVRRHAVALGVGGEARNRPDGAVEVAAEGDRGVLATLIEQIERGPAGSLVSLVRQDWSEGPARYQGFEIIGS